MYTAQEGGGAHGIRDDRGCLGPAIEGHVAMRATTALNTLLGLPGVTVASVGFDSDEVKVGVWLRRKRLLCPEPDCGYTTASRVDTFADGPGERAEKRH